LYKRALMIREATLGRDHPDVAQSLNNLALLYVALARHSEAEPLYKRALMIREATLGREHPYVAQSLDNLALLYVAQARHSEAEPLYKRALIIREAALGREHPDVAHSLNNLAGLYQRQGRYSEATHLYQWALGILETQLGTDHPLVATSVNNLAVLYHNLGHDSDAEPLYKRSLAILEVALGPEHPEVARTLNNLAVLYVDQGRYGEAEPLHRRSLAIRDKSLGPEHPDVAQSLNNLAWLALAQNDLAGAATHWRRASAILQSRAEHGLGTTPTGSLNGEAERSSWYFDGLVKATYRLTMMTRAETHSAAAEMFEMAQWARSSDVAKSLAEMAARAGAGSPDLSGLVRERQDLVGEWQARDKLLIAAKSEPAGKRNAQAEKGLSDRLAAIDARLNEIDAQLAKDFPDYAALASPKPISVAEVQTILRDEEALVLFLDTGSNWEPQLPEETFVWVVTRTDMRWLRSELGSKALDREVAAIRCGVDRTLWHDASGWRQDTDDSREARARQMAKRQVCLEVAGPDAAPRLDAKGNPVGYPRFDAARAHTLFTGLLGEAEDLIRDRTLIVVPSGPLTLLPFNVLVTARPGDGSYATMSWLGARQPIVVLPVVSSLKALRRDAKPSRATSPYLAFANPLLVGRYPQSSAAQRARQWQHCTDLPMKETETDTLDDLLHQLASLPLVGSLFRGALADVAAVKRLSPLPETAQEVCAIARSLGVGEEAVYLGARASEHEVKQSSASSSLAGHKVVHFATHGLVAGQFAVAAEPALILTPPEEASEADDGLLTASEVAALKLDAEWVVLSACNTAAGGGESAEALGGLARAFFYAGARSLLVSNWEVNSKGAVELVTGAFEAARNDPGIGRAEALRRAMVAIIARGGGSAHPAYWAPFMLVGEGGTGR
jgi:CHAT domain-containing protein/tetratricopeptide (TPR) repeat protein